ncbi:hypothetical protein [Nostoc sp. CHAB 5715]|uniref:hypothetical protein n=1 Tax=Nostoc sp. CHAB 5715 TaxID=2780400 RepID=UPI001E2C99B6|nr:hypothetical protein [Nostoc sp. CHAB 5715]MCC5623690.1 hypothetical protein [Nostoc sp. CHAB 5715]
MNPHPLKQREQDLMQFYSYCQLGMTPQQFYSKWQVNHEQMAQICSRSLFTVRRWFARVDIYPSPKGRGF